LLRNHHGLGEACVTGAGHLFVVIRHTAQRPAPHCPWRGGWRDPLATWTPGTRCRCQIRHSPEGSRGRPATAWCWVGRAQQGHLVCKMGVVGGGRQKLGALVCRCCASLESGKWVGLCLQAPCGFNSSTTAGNRGTPRCSTPMIMRQEAMVASPMPRDSSVSGRHSAMRLNRSK
jgi:hypothetical protein